MNEYDRTTCSHYNLKTEECNIHLSSCRDCRLYYNRSLEGDIEATEFEIALHKGTMQCWEGDDE